VLPYSQLQGLKGDTMHFHELMNESDPNYVAMFFVIGAYLTLMVAFLVPH
jgi:hypothetical protein